MEHSLFLRQYKYEIPGLPTGGKSSPVTKKYALRALFDFENGEFQLEGDASYILNDSNRFKSLAKNTRFFIDAKMKPEIPAGPDDNLKNELLLCLKGSILKGDRQYKCSGLLSLNRNWQGQKTQWMIYCNMVDNDLDFFEIRLILPVFTNITQAPDEN